MAQRVKVMVRLRPQNETEKKTGGAMSTRADDASIIVTGDRERQHTFDKAFALDSSQEEVFDAVGTDTINNVIKGYNGTVLAYGQTGSGKTHTMLGPSGGSPQVIDPASPHYQARGVIPRLVESLYERLDAIDPNEVTWTLGVSVFELYKEQVYDSLTEAPRDPSEYRIREDIAGGRGIYIENLYAKRCTTASEVLEAIKFAAGRRKVAATSANETSSRSHSITMLSLSQTNHLMGDTITMSRLTLVDLAGSEKVAKTGAGGERLQEAKSINLSLTLLGNVIFKLTDGKSNYIPYRDSKLTRLLQDSLGGNSCTTLLCCASPAEYNKEETVSTLAFAARAKQITNKPRVNRDLSSGELKTALAKALEEIGDLKERLAMQSEFATRAGGGMSPKKNRSGQAAAAPDAGDGDDEDDGMALLISRLQDEIQELKRRLADSEEKLDISELQADFHRKRAAEADETIAELQARLKREESLYERRIAELTAQLSLAATKEPQPHTPARPGQGETVELMDATAVGIAPTATQQVDMASVDTGVGRKAPVRRVSRGGAVTQSRNVTEGGQPVATQSMQLRLDATGSSAAPAAGNHQPTTLQRRGSGPASKPTSADRSSRTSDTRTGGSFRRVGASGVPRSSSATVAGGVQSEQPVAVRPLVAQQDAIMLDTVGGADYASSPSNAAMQLKIDQLEAALKKANASVDAGAAREKELVKKVDAVSMRYEEAREQADASAAEAEELRRRLAETERRAADMKRILDALNIDVEEQLAEMRRRADEAGAEASRLKSQKDELLEAQGQQEFLDLANAELFVKTEDVDAIEQDVLAIRFEAAADPVRMRASCIETLQQLDDFVEHVISKLDGRRFANANLESSRLNVLGDVTALQSRIAFARNRLNHG